VKVPAYIKVECPHCHVEFSTSEFRQHFCEGHGKTTKQDWFVAVDKALAAAGEPEMIYAYEVEFARTNGITGSFRCAVSSESTARRKAIYQSNFSSILRVTPFTYAQYCRGFGIPGSRM